MGADSGLMKVAIGSMERLHTMHSVLSAELGQVSCHLARHHRRIGYLHATLERGSLLDVANNTACKSQVESAKLRE